MSRCRWHDKKVCIDLESQCLRRIEELEEALQEALTEWETALHHKSDFLRKKHADDEDIARLWSLLGEDADE